MLLIQLEGKLDKLKAIIAQKFEKKLRKKGYGSFNNLMNKVYKEEISHGVPKNLAKIREVNAGKVVLPEAEAEEEMLT